MTPVLVDANILIDIATDDPDWGDWSADLLRDRDLSLDGDAHPALFE